jgi:hypothetical protein
MRTLVLVLAASLVVGCNSDLFTDVASQFSGSLFPAQDTTVRPWVTLGQTDYTKETLQSRVPDSTMFHRFQAAYGGKYTDSLKASLVSWVASRVEALGGNRAEVERCLQATNQTHAGTITLPTVAERARFEGKPVWVFQFIWGMSPDDLGHYRCFVIDAATADTLHYITCR